MAVFPLEYWPLPGTFWPPSPTYAARAFEVDVRVFDELLDNVVFVGLEAGGQFLPLGTGFMASYEHAGHTFNFLVTADHVLRQISGDTAFVRVNRLSGGCEVIPVPKDKAMRHPDTKNDVVMLNMPNIAHSHSVRYWQLDRAHRDKVYEQTWRPAAGDEVTTIGLYTSHYGDAKNVPVVRIGHVAMMPGEPVRTDQGYVDAYLVEVKSIAGLSGSPVYLQVPRIRFGEGTQFSILSSDQSILLGVMIGYHVVESKEDQIAVPQFQQTEMFKEVGGTTAENNTGFGVVIPVDRLFEIMESQDAKDKMNDAIKAIFSASGFRPASAAPSTEDSVAQKSDNPSHKEDFMTLLNAAAQSNKQPIEGEPI